MSLLWACAICPHHRTTHVNGGGMNMPECWRAQPRRITCCHTAFRGTDKPKLAEMYCYSSSTASNRCSLYIVLCRWGVLLLLPLLHAQLGFMNCRVGEKAQAGQWSALLCLSLSCTSAGDFGSPIWNLPFSAQFSNTKALKEPAAIHKPDAISAFIACFTSAKTKE